jgi:multiple sugar transport system substrate-binding protein
LPWKARERMQGAGFFRKVFLPTALLLTLLWSVACSKQSREIPRQTQTTAIVFKHGKIAGDPAQFRQLLDRFERENPGITVQDETLPASTDEQHQFYAINLEGKSRDFDVLALDVIWVQEFARAGWLRDVTDLLAPGEENAFFPGPARAVTYGNRLYALPWYIDAGLLYYRADLLKKYNYPVPRTWPELVKTAQAITAREKDVYGFIWQGKQYEGLVCTALEFIRSNNGGIIRQGKPVLDSPQNREALGFMRDLIVKFNVTPPLVTNAIEEPTRHLFGSGKALFMRNWPYAWNIFERKDSAVQGKTGVAPLPSFPGSRSASTLGGWQLGVNRFTRHPKESEKLVRFLTSAASQKALALSIGYKPTRKALYKDPDLVRQQPFMASLYGIFLRAQPRPVTPYYMMFTQVLQSEFSAAIAGVKTPGAALASAQNQIEHMLEAGQ